MYKMNLEHVMQGNKKMLRKYEKHVGICLKGLPLAKFEITGASEWIVILINKIRIWVHTVNKLKVIGEKQTYLY